MKAVLLAVLALIATDVQSFQGPILLANKATTALRNSRFDEGASPPPNQDPYPLANVNPFMEKKKQKAAESATAQQYRPPAVSAPPAPSATSAPPSLQQPPYSAAPIQSDNEIKGLEGINPLVVAGAVFVGMPLWLLLATNVFFGGNTTPPPSPSSISLPTTVMTSGMANSAAKPAGVVQLAQPITKAEVRDLFNLWNDALKTGDPNVVVQRYAKNGVLLPTLSDIPRNDPAAIKDYFVGFMAKKPVGKILEGEIFVGNNWAQDAGIYQFTFQDGSVVKARYSFIYVYEDGQWKISHHHSSLMPQEVVRPVAVTKEEVRGFFDLWNNALKTGDPQVVTARYTKDAVLLPTLSDSARYTNDRIADYFVGFLKKKPTGKILEGNVKTGPNWAQDAGIYEFTFQDGSTVKGRYSFVYAYENGEWKIAHHHSSIMPEGAVAAMKKVAAMETATPAPKA